MKKKSRLFYNTSVAFANQIVVIICNFILPRQIIMTFGSDTNGLVTSISQFLGFISLMDMGVGAVVRSSLYKPLVDNDFNQISMITKSARSFYHKLGLALIAYITILCFLYPKISNDLFGYAYIVPLIIAISISSIAQYFFGIVNQLLLDADQRSYVQLSLNLIAVFFNTVISVALMRMGYSIQFVKFAASIVLLIKPLGMLLFVKQNYKINKNIEIYKEPISQKWNGLAQHVAAYILSNTDVVVLTFFSTMKNVSIYNMYYLVVAGVRQCIITIMTGVDALFGKLYATKSPKLENTFNIYEWIVHTVVSFVFSVTAVLICPFVGIYTKGVNDANYILPIFGILITAAFGLYSIRLPYNTMVLAAGHYKQTQTSAIIEATINIVLSIITVRHFGLYGAAIGTFVAMLYRTVYLAYYLKKEILFREFKIFIKHMIVDVVTVILIYFSTKPLVRDVESYFEWIFLSVQISIVGIFEVAFINIILYKDESKQGLELIRKKIIRKR